MLLLLTKELVNNISNTNFRITEQDFKNLETKEGDLKNLEFQINLELFNPCDRLPKSDNPLSTNNDMTQKEVYGPLYPHRENMITQN